MLRTTSPLLISCLLLASVSGAQATSLTALDILDQFNLVTTGDFASSADVEGRAAIGGNLNSGATFYNNPNTTRASAYAGLTLWGNASGGNYNINNGGGAIIGGTNAGTLNLNGGGNAFVGDTNTGNISAAAGTVTVGAGNSGTLNAGGAVIVNGANNGQINTGAATIAINGSNSATVQNNGANISINGNTGNVNMNGGTLRYAGSRNGNLNLNGGATAVQGAVTLATPASPLPNFTSSFTNILQAASTNIANLVPDGLSTATYNANNNTIAFNAAPNASGQAVISINTSFFRANASVSVNLNNATSLFINVNVDTCTQGSCGYTFANNLNFLNTTGYAGNVVWNFTNATALNFTTVFGGTVLALGAAVTNSTPINGTLVAKSFNGTGELHSYAFAGSLPGASVSSASQATAVPEPASFALLGVGLFGLFAMRRWLSPTARKA